MSSVNPIGASIASPPTIVSGTVLGIDLGGTNARAGVVRQRQLGDVLSIRIDSKGSVGDIVKQIYGLIDRTIAHDVEAIGIGVPSVVDVVRGIVYDVHNIPSWREVHLKSILEERYSVPVSVNNDANCFALGEKRFGKGIGYPSLVGLILGTGFAGGIIIDDKLYGGMHCGAGEFGMIRYLDSIYEHYCSGQFFTRRAGLTGAEVHDRADAGDQEALQLMAEFGLHLGQGIKTILYAYDPELIVLGGSVRKAFPFFQATMWESIGSLAFSTSITSLKIEVSELDHVAILGAAALPHR